MSQKHKNTEITKRRKEARLGEGRWHKGTEHSNSGSFTMKEQDVTGGLVPLGSRVNKCPHEPQACKKVPICMMQSRELQALTAGGEKGKRDSEFVEMETNGVLPIMDKAEIHPP